jgi:hypothetical protein
MAAPAPRRFRLVRWFAAGVVGSAAVLALFTWATLTFSYGRGERVGFVQKLSRRGWICKTWEGELAVATVPGVAPDKFYFSLRDAPIAAQVKSTLGKRVRVVYAQHKWIPTTCFGETEFFVAEANAVE